MNNRLIPILLFLSFALCASAQASEKKKERLPKDSIYQGMSVKVDIAMPILELARSKGKIQDY